MKHFDLNALTSLCRSLKVVSSDYIGNSHMGLETAPGNYNHLATTKTVYSPVDWLRVVADSHCETNC